MSVDTDIEQAMALAIKFWDSFSPRQWDKAKELLVPGSKARVSRMKAKKAKIVLQSVDSIKEEWTAGLKEKVLSTPKDDEIMVTGLETIANILAKTRMEILQAIITRKPQSIYELAKIVDRDFKNVYADVQFLNDVGLIKLKSTGDSRKGLKPIAKYSGIELDLVA